MSVRKREREVLKLVAPLGCVLDGYSKAGHLRIVLPTGDVVFTAGTPSSPGADKAMLRDIRAKLGVAAPRSKGTYKKHVGRETFYRSRAHGVRVDSVSCQYDQLAQEHRDICEQITVLQRKGDREGCAAQVRQLLDVEARIEKLGRRAPLRTFRAGGAA